MWRSSSIRCLSKVIGESSVTDEITKRDEGARGPFEAQRGNITKNKSEDAAHTTAACGLVQLILTAWSFIRSGGGVSALAASRLDVPNTWQSLLITGVRLVDSQDLRYVGHLGDRVFTAGGYSVKIHLNKFSIWMEGEKPCCSPGSIEENLTEVFDFIRLADEWVAAVQEIQAARRQELTTRI
jgi:hypothetical protein